jgi:hypothetical protein
VSLRGSYQVFRALGWLRWRMLVNTITRSGARDLLERLSRAAESLLPTAILVLLVPSALALLSLGFHAGSLVGTGDRAAVFPLQLVRWILLASVVLTLMGPMLLSGGLQPATMTRLLLLPISSRLLYAAHCLGALAEPWVFLTIPLLLGLVAGALARGAVPTGGVMFAASLVFLLVLLGLAAFVSATLQLLVRNRRRAELLVLLGMLGIVIVSLLPSALIPDEDTSGKGGTQAPALPAWVEPIAAAIPSELFVRVVREATPASAYSPGRTIAILAAWALAAHVVTWPVYQRLLRTPATTGGRTVSGGARLFTSLPGVGSRTAAIAVAYLRLALRTPRGRTIALVPIVLLAVFAALVHVRGSTLPLGPVNIGGGYSLGMFGISMALMSLAPFGFNQFAIDRAGLILEFLSPVSTRELLYGKAVGGLLIAGLPCALSVAAGVLTGGGSAWLWTAILSGALSAYIILSPVAALLSLVFPRTVDLSSIGQGSNAHQAAGLLGVLAFGFACVPPAALALIGLRTMESEPATTALLVAWTATSLVPARLGFLVAERLLEKRRENLAFVAAGR